jgi:hypothetical protein
MLHDSVSLRKDPAMSRPNADSAGSLSGLSSCGSVKCKASWSPADCGLSVAILCVTLSILLSSATEFSYGICAFTSSAKVVVVVKSCLAAKTRLVSIVWPLYEKEYALVSSRTLFVHLSTTKCFRCVKDGILTRYLSHLQLELTTRLFIVHSACFRSASQQFVWTTLHFCF